MDGGVVTVTGYDQRGFPTTMVQVQGGPKSYNEQGFLITSTPSLAARSSPTAVAQAADSETTAAAEANKKVTKTSAAVAQQDSRQPYFAAVCGLAVLVGSLVL